MVNFYKINQIVSATMSACCNKTISSQIGKTIITIYSNWNKEYFNWKCCKPIKNLIDILMYFGNNVILKLLQIQNITIVIEGLQTIHIEISYTDIGVEAFSCSNLMHYLQWNKFIGSICINRISQITTLSNQHVREIMRKYTFLEICSKT